MPLAPIRPQVHPAAGPTRPADPARLAAQKAFFDMALGKAAGTSAPTASAALAAQTPQAQPQIVSRTPDSNAPAPTKILRPGSLLDIRV